MNNGQKTAAKWIYFLFIFAMVVLCVLAVVWPHGENNFQRGVTIYYPVANSEIGQDFMVNGSVYAKEGIEKAELVFEPFGETFPIQRETITYEGKTLLTLSTFKNEVVLQGEGPADIRVKIYTPSGKTYALNALSVDIKKGALATTFKMFSPMHLIPLGVLVLVFFLMLWLYRKKPGRSVGW